MEFIIIKEEMVSCWHLRIATMPEIWKIGRVHLVTCFFSKKQSIVTLSTTEAEFVAATVCACQGVWMKRILKELGHFDGGCTTMMCDNSSTIKLSKNLVMHGRSKHIDVRFHFLRNLTKEGTIELVHCGS